MWLEADIQATPNWAWRRVAASLLRAQPVNSNFLLRELAALEIPRERENWCHHDAEEPVIDAGRSIAEMIYI
jgi:hypothetical protein